MERVGARVEMGLRGRGTLAGEGERSGAGWRMS